MTYAINSFDVATASWKRITSEQIIAALDEKVPLQRAWANYVRDLEKRLSRYSGEHGDVLSGAYAAIGKTEVAKYQEGFVKAWA